MLKDILNSSNLVQTMQEQRAYLERLSKISDELFELGLKMSLDHREQIEIEASEKRIEKLYNSQYLFVKRIEKEVLKRHFVKQNGRPYNGRDSIIKLI